MEIKGKVHCFFEQSGTFKNEFIKLGIPAEDYDIQDNFGQTDHKIDLFNEIEEAYRGGQSIFDSITCDDLIMAFFPCIYFETLQQKFYSLDAKSNFRSKPLTYQIDYAIDRIEKRTKLHSLLYKMTHIALDRGLRLVIENPATEPNFLITGQNYPRPTIIDKNRMLRGDYSAKPTAYWFWNCINTNGLSIQNDKKQKRIKYCERSKGDGLCSKERSMISPDYARNFICDFVIGKIQKGSQMSLF